MLTLGTAPIRTCQGLSRRDFLHVGGIGALGLTLADAWRHPAPAAERRETACICIWLDGGPSQFETFDPKPNTPDTIRGPYGALRTNVPGIHFSELLPMLAGHMGKCAVIRSASHKIDSHAPMPMLTGLPTSPTAYGAVVTRLKGHAQEMPAYVHLGSKLSAGVGGGTLGAAYDPIEVSDPTGSKVELPQFSLSADLAADRFRQRTDLLAAIDRMRADAHSSHAVEKMDTFYQRAVHMLTSLQVREAFDLAKEKPSLRERYGANFFGQSCLLARRLVEAGTRFVQVKWYDGPAFDGWDVHGADLAGLSRMEQHLCPRLDQGLSALLEDLHQRGLQRSTLIVVLGEFGRTPKVNKYAGRDHWPYCFSVLLAGAGVPGGTIVGASDGHGAYPANRPVSPTELAATLYRLLGIDINTDPRVRPFIGTATAVSELV